LSAGYPFMRLLSADYFSRHCQQDHFKAIALQM